MNTETEQETIMVRGYRVEPFTNVFGNKHYRVRDNVCGLYIAGRDIEAINQKIMEVEDAALKSLMLPNPDPGMPDPIKTPCRASSQVFEWLYGKRRPDLDATECRVRILVDGKEVQAREWYVANGEIIVEGVTE